MRSIIRKERLKRDPEAQALEDCACLVFLENEFVPFAEKHQDDKIVDIVAKTWVKMSEAGHAEAVAMLPALPERLQTFGSQGGKGGVVCVAQTPSFPRIFMARMIGVYLSDNSI